MNFSSLGTLRCLCGNEPPEGLSADRRDFCRDCGLEVVAVDASLLEKNLSKKEIERRVLDLRVAGIRARNLEVPTSIHTVDELMVYLDSDEKKSTRTPPTRPSTVGHAV